MGINILHGFSKRAPNNSARRPAFIMRGKLLLHRNTSDLRCADIPYLSAVLSQAYHMIRQAAHQPGFFLLYARRPRDYIFREGHWTDHKILHNPCSDSKSAYNGCPVWHGYPWLPYRYPPTAPFRPPDKTGSGCGAKYFPAPAGLPPSGR